MARRTDSLARQHRRVKEISAEDILKNIVTVLRGIVRSFGREGIKGIINSPDPHISTAVVWLLIGLDPALDDFIKSTLETFLVQAPVGKEKETPYTQTVNKLQLLKLQYVKTYMKNIERGDTNPEITKVKVDAISRFTDFVQALVSSHGLSDQEITDVLSKTTSHVHDIFQAAQNHIPFEEAVQQKAQALQKKSDLYVQSKPESIGKVQDLSDIPKWGGRKKDGMPLDFIKAHYGQWLSAFSDDQDAIFQDQICKHDKRLITGIENQLRQERQGRKVRDFIKPRSARTDREVEVFTSDSLRHAWRVQAAKRRRQAKSQALPKLSSH